MDPKQIILEKANSEANSEHGLNVVKDHRSSNN